MARGALLLRFEPVVSSIGSGRTRDREYIEDPGTPVGNRSVEADVKRVLASPSDYLDVAANDPQRARKTSGRARDSARDDSPAFVVRDGDYVSARWPGDSFAFAKTMTQVIAETTAASASAGSLRGRQRQETEAGRVSSTSTTGSLTRVRTEFV